jgi:hypothetical protein
MITLKLNNLEIYFDAGDISVNCGKFELIDSLCQNITRDNIDDLVDFKLDYPNEFKKLDRLIKSKRKAKKEAQHVIRNFIFHDYDDSPYILNVIRDLNNLTEPLQQLDLMQFIEPVKSLDQYIKDEIDFYMTPYETIHDRLLYMFKNGIYVDVSPMEETIPYWNDADNTYKVDWRGFEEYLADSVTDGLIKEYQITKLLQNLTHMLRVEAIDMWYFRPKTALKIRKRINAKGSQITTGIETSKFLFLCFEIRDDPSYRKFREKTYVQVV